MNNTIIALLVCTAFLVLGFALGYGLRNGGSEVRGAASHG